MYVRHIHVHVQAHQIAGPLCMCNSDEHPSEEAQMPLINLFCLQPLHLIAASPFAGVVTGGPHSNYFIRSL